MIWIGREAAYMLWSAAAAASDGQTLGALPPRLVHFLHVYLYMGTPPWS